MARFSLRSFAGVASFMATGILSASVSTDSGPISQYFRDSSMDVASYLPTQTANIIASVLGGLGVVAAFAGLFRKAPEDATDAEKEEFKNNRRKIIPAIFSAILFSVGLVVSQMTKFSKIYGFLDMKLIKAGTWDPTLILVMGGGFIVSFLSYQWVKGHGIINQSRALDCPLGQKGECGQFSVPTNKTIDANLIVGELIFGLGWGTAGWCPGPAMFLAFAGYPYLLYRWWPAFFVGSLLGEQAKSIKTYVRDRRNIVDRENEKVQEDKPNYRSTEKTTGSDEDTKEEELVLPEGSDMA